jgi:hypothetical protein
MSTDTSQVKAANMRSFIESVRRKAPVVYVGSVKKVDLLQRTKFDIKARALVEGGPQYQLQPGVKVVVFASSFASTIPPGYLLQGSREELLHRVEALRDALSQMPPDQLKVHEINKEDRRIQLDLYEKLCAYLRTSK